MKMESERDEDSKSGSTSFLFSLYQKFKKHIVSENTEADAETDEAEENAKIKAKDIEEMADSPLTDDKSTAAEPKPSDAISYDSKQQPLILLALQQICHEWTMEKGQPTRGPSFENYLGDSVSFNEEIEALLKNLDSEAQNMIKAVEATSEASPRPPIDGRVMAYISKDSLHAWEFVFPPLLGGKPVSRDDILGALKAMDVTTGIDGNAIDLLAQESKCMKLIQVAAGTAPENGENGRIEEVIPQTVGTPYMESDADLVDYKNLNWLVHVQENDIICRIIPATSGKSGISVLGKEIACVSGKKPTLPMGKNTQLSEDGTQIVAKTDGQIFYENGQYKVTDIININGDVDLSTGNIDVKGNVLVQGNVLDGFCVKATGDVNIAGIVGMGTVEAGGNIFVRSGINGNEQGRLCAGGDIKCRYIESANIYADGSIYADSIANSTVVCGDTVAVESGHGAIIGGSITAMAAIHVKEVGNERGQVTRLNLERPPEFIAQKEKVTKESQVVQEQVDTAQNQLKMLEKGEDPEIQAAVKNIHFRLSIFLVKQEKLKQKMKEIREKEEKLSMAQIRIATMYPTVAARINGVSRVFDKEATNCLIFQSGTDLELGRT